MTDKITLDTLTEVGTPTMVALSTYAQACLAVACVYRFGGAEREVWEDRAAQALTLVVELYG